MGNIILTPQGLSGVTPRQVVTLTVSAWLNCYTGGFEASAGAASFNHLPEVLLIDCAQLSSDPRSNASTVLALGSPWGSLTAEKAQAVHTAFYWVNVSGSTYSKGAKISIVFTLEKSGTFGLVRATPQLDVYPIDAYSGSCGPGRTRQIQIASISKQDFTACFGA